MKSYKDLFEKYIHTYNIDDAIANAKKHKKPHVKRKIEEISEDAKNSYKNLKSQILSYTPKPKKPIEIYDGISRKKRKIVVPNAFDLVVQHLQVNILKPIFLKGMYEHTYAAIPGRGVHLAKDRVEKWISHYKDKTLWCLKCDIRHYFESINIDILKNKLSKIIKDKKFLIELFKIIDTQKQGIPLGYYTSQYYANFYLKEFDHYIKENLKPEHYIRYMDDLVLFDTDKNKLKDILNKIKIYLNDLHLSLKFFNFKIIDDKNFIDFLGFKFYKNRTTLRKKILKNIRRKSLHLKNFFALNLRQIVSYYSWLKITNTYNFYMDKLRFRINLMCKILSI